MPCPCFHRLRLAPLLAALTLARPSFAEPPPPASAQSEAKVRYEQGVTAYQAGRYQAAVEHFLAADRLVGSAPLSFNVARAYEKLGDSARALAAYRDYMRRDPRASNADQVNARIAELEATLERQGVQQLSVRSEPDAAELSIDGRRVGLTPWTGELTPGAHRLVLAKPGYSAVVRDVQLPAARATDLEFQLPAAPAAAPKAPGAPAAPAATSAQPSALDTGPRERRGPSIWPWLALGAGGASLLGAGVLEILRRSAEDDARSARTQPDYVDRYRTMHSRQTAARVFVGVGAAFAIAGGVLLYVELQQRPRRASAAIGCAEDACFAELGGRF